MRKKNLFVLLILFAVICVSGCGIKEEQKESKWDVSLTSKNYSDSYCTVYCSEMLTSSNTYISNGNEYICSQKKASKGRYLLFEIKGKYTGTAVYSGYINNFRIVYGKDYIVLPDSVFISVGNKKWVYIDGEAVNRQNIVIDPLEETDFIIRGAFDINTRIESDKGESLILKTPFGEEYNLR